MSPVSWLIFVAACGVIGLVATVVFLWCWERWRWYACDYPARDDDG